MAEHEECISPNLVFATTAMSDYTRNRYRLDTTSATIGLPGQIITCNFPEASLLDMKSFRFYFKVTTQGSGTGTDQVYARVSDDSSNFIQKLEVYLNGVQVSSGQNEYNSMARLIKIGKSSADRNATVGRLIEHSIITAAAADEQAYLCVGTWNGFLNDLSTRFLPTSLMGQIQVRITLAPNAVLVPCQTIGGNAAIINAPFQTPSLTGPNLYSFSSAQAALNAQQMTYQVSDIRFSIDAISVCPAYNEMLSQQLSREGELKLNYRELYTFLASNILTNRYALASSSIDMMIGSLRPGDYNQVGKPALYAPTFGSSTNITNYLAFQNFDPDGATVPVSNQQSQFSINNVLCPQYLQFAEDSMNDLSYVWDKVGADAKGIIPGERTSFKTGYFEVPLVLNHPSGMGLSVRSGYNSRGVNSTMLFNLFNIPSATLPASYNNIVVVASTAQLKIGMGRSLAVDF